MKAKVNALPITPSKFSQESDVSEKLRAHYLVLNPQMQELLPVK